MHLVNHGAGRQFFNLCTGLQDDGANRIPTDMPIEGLQDLFEEIGDRVRHSEDSRQRFLQGTGGLSALHEGDAGSKAGVAAQITNGGKQFFPLAPRFGDAASRLSVSSGVSEAPAARAALVTCQQGPQSVPEQVAGRSGESMDAGRMTWVAGAKRVGEKSTRQIINTAPPQDGGQHPREVRHIGDLNRALKLSASYTEADPETAVGSRRQARVQTAGCP